MDAHTHKAGVEQVLAAHAGRHAQADKLISDLATGRDRPGEQHLAAWHAARVEEIRTRRRPPFAELERSANRARPTPVPIVEVAVVDLDALQD